MIGIAAVFLVGCASNETAIEPDMVRQMDTNIKYDDASWHYGGEFPEASPIEYGGTHIALFLKWAFQKGWAGQFHLDHSADAVNRVISGELSATDFLFTYCDGRLTTEDLNSAGNEIAAKYYGDQGLYLLDYYQHFGSLMYVAPESEHDFERFSSLMDQRVRSGVLTQADTP